MTHPSARSAQAPPGPGLADRGAVTLARYNDNNDDEERNLMTLPNYDAWLSTNPTQEYWERAYEYWLENHAAWDYERAIDNEHVCYRSPEVIETLEEWIDSSWGERYFEAWEETQHRD